MIERRPNNVPNQKIDTSDDSVNKNLFMKNEIPRDQSSGVIPVIRDGEIIDDTASSISVGKIDNKPVAVEKLTIEDAAKEYLTLLVDLGADFTNHRAQTNSSPSGNKFSIYEVDSFIQKYGAEYEEKNYVIHEVAKLLDAEITWRDAGETIREINENISKIDKDAQNMSLIKRLFTSRERRKTKNKLQDEIDISKLRSFKANQQIGKVLNVNYSKSGENSYHPSDRKENEAISDQLNAKFFSNDRSSKIERAVEIRTKFFDKEGHLKNKRFSESRVWFGKLEV